MKPKVIKSSPLISWPHRIINNFFSEKELQWVEGYFEYGLKELRKKYWPLFDKDGNMLPGLKLQEEAQKDGIQPVQMQVVEDDKLEIKKVYLGMVMLYEDKKETIPVIQTATGLEYLITTKIKTLVNTNKKTVGIVNLSKTEEVKTENLSNQLRQHHNVQSLDLSNEDLIMDNIDVKYAFSSNLAELRELAHQQHQDC